MSPHDYLLNESLALLSRLEQTKPFTMTIPMVSAASISPSALDKIQELLGTSKLNLTRRIETFIQKVKYQNLFQATTHELQSEFVHLKLRFNNILDQFDIFADVLTQRSEHETGVWIAGLDRLAEDALRIPGYPLSQLPEVVVFLERGHGAAIRRARTRLPGGDENPVAVIQVPRERMIGSGIASSLVHEVGHQASEVLNLTGALRLMLIRKSAENKSAAWKLFQRWISEIIADYWALGLLGITATAGLMNVVTLPEYFQFRIDIDDPHPAPYIRVKLSCAFGHAIYPHPQWAQMWGLWETFYRKSKTSPAVQRTLREIDKAIPEFIRSINTFPVPGRQITLVDLFPIRQRTPAVLQQHFRDWRRRPMLAYEASPTLLFAVIGQAKTDMLINAKQEARILSEHLNRWAFNGNEKNSKHYNYGRQQRQVEEKIQD